MVAPVASIVPDAQLIPDSNATTLAVKPAIELRRFVVFPGNHPEAVRDALVKRGNFQEVRLSTSAV